MLLFVRLSVGGGAVDLAHWMPNSNGFASGEPLILSMLSSMRGIRSKLLLVLFDGGLLPG